MQTSGMNQGASWETPLVSFPMLLNSEVQSDFCDSADFLCICPPSPQCLLATPGAFQHGVVPSRHLCDRKAGLAPGEAVGEGGLPAGGFLKTDMGAWESSLAKTRT